MVSMHQTQCVPQLEKTWILSVLLLMCEIENSISQSQHARIFLKGQLNSEWIYEVIVSPQMPTVNYPDFCPTKQTRVVAQKTAYTHQKITKNKCYDHGLFGRAEILVIFGLHFGRNDDLINLFWI